MSEREDAWQAGYETARQVAVLHLCQLRARFRAEAVDYCLRDADASASAWGFAADAVTDALRDLGDYLPESSASAPRDR